ncbi:MAG: cyclopropane-fatty-acyl-phospholipid synthase family protein [Bryobacter sp.]
MNAAALSQINLSTSWERKLFGNLLSRLQGGQLTLVENGLRSEFGQAAEDELHAEVIVHDDSFFRSAVLGGEIGMGEAFMDGAWSSPDLLSVIRLAVRNLSTLTQTNSWLSQVALWANRWRHLGRDNSLSGSRENIRRHYDLSNEFFQLWLDPTLSYSAALWQQEEETLEQAQRNKIDRACRELRLHAADHLLEIGSGWGSLAMHAAQHYGCRVTTTTISQAQYELATARIAAAGLSSQITVRLDDYRLLSGKYSKVVSIEMFEAVGLAHYDEYFAAVERLLLPGGRFLLQTITMNERAFPGYQATTDWIQKYIFPGGELSSLLEIQKSMARVSTMLLTGQKEFGLDYARTLAHWRESFHAQLDRVHSLGFDERFCRMWDYYLAYCEGSFRERYIGVSQLLLEKPPAIGA